MDHQMPLRLIAFVAALLLQVVFAPNRLRPSKVPTLPAPTTPRISRSRFQRKAADPG